MDDGYFDLDYLNTQEAEYEDKFLRHICFKEPLTIVIEGKYNKAAIFKEGYTININKGSLEESIDELPPDGFM